MDALLHIDIGEESFYSQFLPFAEGDFRVVDCPCLLDIETHYHSFFSYTTCVMDRLSSLRTITLGACCFFRARQFVLSSGCVLESSVRRHGLLRNDSYWEELHSFVCLDPV